GTGPIVPSHIYVSEYLGGSGRTDIWQVNVNSSSYPIAITLIMPNWTSSSNPDFDLYLYNPSGSLVAYSTGTTRQEYIGYTPTATGNYRIYVRSYTGLGNYFFDLSSANATSLTLIQDQDKVANNGEENIGAMSSEEKVLPTIKITNIQKGQFSFIFNLLEDEKINLSIYDRSGRMIKNMIDF
ncbi:MAG: PPC domain-containing protein, partial [candidate division WOR-3 bacterium]|nr:PPC domain-containing protein [candidate division WOR-3 bacterium]